MRSSTRRTSLETFLSGMETFYRYFYHQGRFALETFLSGMETLEYLVEQAGGQIVGKMAVLAEGDAIKRDDIIVLEQLSCSDTQASEFD